MRVGRWDVEIFSDGTFKLDGGSMFGVLPKVLWERQTPADASTRVEMDMSCLLLRDGEHVVVVETGAGPKLTERQREIFGIDRPPALLGELARRGVRPDEVTLVINTHLHFDHAGGNSFRDASGAVRVAFPNARYVVQAGEYAYATHTNERTAASYFPHNFQPVLEAGRFELVEGERELLPGIRVLPTPGHTPHHQSVLLDSGGERALYAADLIPTHAHLPLGWIMGYDVEPLVTLETKRRVLERAHAEGWLLIFEHDAHVPWGRVAHDGKAYGLQAVAAHA